MPKYWLSLLLCLSIAIQSNAQSKHLLALTKACKDLDSALIQVSDHRLQSLLHPDLSLGHSNGLLENKTELLEHLHNGYLKYMKIESLDTPSINIYKNMATLRRSISVKGALQQKDFEVKLRVLETWLWEKSKWSLLNRQSVKIN